MPFKKGVPRKKMDPFTTHGWATLGARVAGNFAQEIRYWDSLRNWGSAGALKDLMDSSRALARTEVTMFRCFLEMLTGLPSPSEQWKETLVV